MLKVWRTESGLYCIEQENGARWVGGAASTIIRLTQLLFLDEANNK